MIKCNIQKLNLERKGKNFQFLRCVSQLFNVQCWPDNLESWPLLTEPCKSLFSPSHVIDYYGIVWLEEWEGSYTLEYHKAYKALVLGQLYSIKQLKQTADVPQNYNGDDICWPAISLCTNTCSWKNILKF